MITFTDAARRQILDNMDVEGQEQLALRLSARREGPGSFDYDLLFVGKDEREPEDTVVDAGGFTVLLDTESARYLAGTTVDFVHDLQRIGFRFDNPNSGWDDPVARKVQKILDEGINPQVASHGGHIVLLGVDDGAVRVEMRGGCQGCGKAAQTLRQGVESMLREAVPEMTRLVDVTDHGAGTTPYFPGEDPAGHSPFEEKPSKA